MQYECRICGTTFKYKDAIWKHGYLVCPSCGSEDLTVINPLVDGDLSLEVDAFPIDIETLADADYNKSNWIMEQARIDVVETVIKSLTIEDKKRLQLYQERNNPCKEVE